MGTGAELLLLAGGAFAAALVVGLAGFGDALVLAALWLHVLPPTQTAPLVVLLGCVSYAISCWALRRALRPRRILPLVAGGLLGVPVGAALLVGVDAQAVRRTVGAVLGASAALGLLGWRADASRAPPAADAALGAAGGVLGGLAGLSGVLPTLWSGWRGWAPDERRAVYQPYVLVMHVTAVVFMAAHGLITVLTLERLAWCLPGTALGAWLGQRAYRHLDARRFTALVHALLLAGGVSLLL